MTVTFSMNDILYVVGSFACVAGPIALLFFFFSTYKVVPRDEDGDEPKEKQW